MLELIKEILSDVFMICFQLVCIISVLRVGLFVVFRK
jgi:hypothetical protein